MEEVLRLQSEVSVQDALHCIPGELVTMSSRGSICS
jgi:hypothetical protein